MTMVSIPACVDLALKAEPSQPHNLRKQPLIPIGMQCEAASEFNDGPIRISSLNPSYLMVLIVPPTYTVMFYDYFLTLSLEINLVWSSKWCLAKFLYVATTYFNLTNMVVSAPGFITACSGTPQIFAALEASVLLFRTWILWERNKNISIGLVGLSALLTIPSIIFVASGIRHQEVPGSRPIVGSIAFYTYGLLTFYELGVWQNNIVVVFTIHLHKLQSRLIDILVSQWFFSGTSVFNLYNSSIISNQGETRLLSDHHGPVSGRDLTRYATVEVTSHYKSIRVGSIKKVSPTLEVTAHSVLTKRMFLNLRSVASEDSSESWVPNSTFVAVPGLQSTSDISVG
ncbi:hypothetical protein K439DRAFT_1615348 [Ramaria rubella]|nr:hypothetical protein K439DRAFT_1615348 [Ramaria rubella]